MKTIEKPRPIKELLIILRDNLPKGIKINNNNGGICSVIYQLSSYEIISAEEREILLNYLKNNKPPSAVKRKKIYKGIVDPYGFLLEDHWWKPRVVKPRLNWLNKQINKL